MRGIARRLFHFNACSSTLAATGLILAVLIIYRPSLDHGFACLDDNLYVTENPRVIAGLSLEGIVWAFSFQTGGYWHPLTWLSHMLDCDIFGINPAGHHLSNLLLHMANTLLLFFLMRRLTGAFWRSMAVAALFALHPLNVESVVWIASRKNLLSTFFWMLALWSYSRYAEQPRLSLYLVVFVCLGFGLSAKPMLVTLPLVLLLIDYWPLRRLRTLTPDSIIGSTIPSCQIPVRSAARLIIEKLPLLALSVGSIGISLLWSQKNNILVSNESVHLSLRIENGLTSYLTYLFKTFWPSDLAIFYAYPEYIPGWQAVGSALLLLILTVLFLWKRKHFPFLLLGWGWYLITLLPVIGLVQQGLWPAWADRFAYVPLIGPFIMLSWGVPALVPARTAQRTLLAFSCFAFLSVMAITTCHQIRYWKDNEGLLRHAIASSGQNHLAHSSLAHLLVSKRRIDEAIAHYSEALRILPENPLFHYALATTLLSKGKNEDAIDHFMEALRFSPDNPEILTNLGSALRRQGKLDEASYYLGRALEIRPIPEAHHNLGLLYAGQGRFDEAITHYRQALQLRPADARVHNDLGVALHFAGDSEKALSHLAEAVRLEPGNMMARHNLDFIREQCKERSKRHELNGRGPVQDLSSE